MDKNVDNFEIPSATSGEGIQPKGAAIPFAVTAVVGGNFFLVLNVSAAANGVVVVNAYGIANVAVTKNAVATK